MCKVGVGEGGEGSGWSVGMVPRKILKCKGYEVASESIFGQIQCFSEAI